uniref:rhamnogalacturonan endolyase n=1 Tax=Ananas comosus var. bracteatus TaxID=296719 RepID=A0A6V7NFJ0_ANACO|nr:unnamed protein product [Ananas comosus var. bracteatus]
MFMAFIFSNSLGGVIITNDIIELTISKPEGRITGIRYNGIDNLLQYSSNQSNLGGLEGAEFKVIVQKEHQVEVSFSRTWNPSLRNGVRLNVDIRYIVLLGSSGFYSYAIFEHKRGWPGLDLSETRIAFKLREDKFRYMAVADDRRRKMPRAEDRQFPRAVTLAYKEAVRIVNPLEPEFKGEVDDKYQYTVANKDSRVHGWICSDPPTGFWVITPSNEFRAGGPLRQELTSHVGPTSLAIFLSDHYTGRSAHFQLEDGEHWKKVLGPIFIYLNSAANQRDVALHLWENAKAQMQIETKRWPYDFPASVDFPKLNQRGLVFGKLMVRDRCISKYDIHAEGAYIGLALPGEPGSWQRERKGYQFWTRSNPRGDFVIKNIRPGRYNLYAWVPGFIGDFMHKSTITINPGGSIKLGTLVFEPPRSGPTLWEIGVPDRSAAEFFVPDPRPEYVNRLFINHPEKYRQYGLWERYADLYPKEDLVYKVGVSDYKRDWKVGNSFEPTTWRIKFSLNFVETSRTYTLRLAIAAAHYARLEVRVNNPNGEPHFTTVAFGDGNAIARHGIHGLQWNFDVRIEGRLLYTARIRSI